MPDNEQSGPGTGTPPPNIARIYDYLLGGKDHYSSDREVGARIEKSTPQVHLGVQQQRAVLRRVVRHLVAEVGLRQLIDIGSGLPTASNVHEVAQQIDPETKVVYVDNDPVVLVHARALLADNKHTIVVDGDLLRPEAILDDPGLQGHLDLDQPVGLLLCGIMHYVQDEEDPAGLVRRLHERLAPGSHVFIHHLVTPSEDDVQAQAIEDTLRQSVGRGRLRTTPEVAALLDGLELIEPGVTTVAEWRPDQDTPSVAAHPVLRLAVAAVARKP